MDIKVKLKYKNTKWVKINESASFDEFVNLAKTKFEELMDKKITFCDMENCILDEDFLMDFIRDGKENCNTIVIKTDDKLFDGHSSMEPVLNHFSYQTMYDNDWTTVMPSTSNQNQILDVLPYPTETDNTNISVQSVHSVQSSDLSSCAPSKCEPDWGKETITCEQLKNLIINRNGHTIFEEYEILKCLSNSKRRLLVNLTVSIMFEKYGSNIPTFAKTQFAKAIIDMLPLLKDPHGQKGYEAFYNVENHDGYLEWRIRNEKRKFLGNDNRKVKNVKVDQNKETIQAGPQLDDKELAEQIKWLKNACPRNDKVVIFEKMRYTFENRRVMVMNDSIKILQEYPRFIDMPELIEQDFTLLYKNSPTLADALPLLSEKILLIYESTVLHPCKNILGKESDDCKTYDPYTRSILALLQMLSPTAKGKKRGSRENSSVLSLKLLLFKKTNITFEDVLKERATTQPFLIFEGNNPASTSTFHLVVDTEIISLPGAVSAVEAFDYLFMSHYVFNIKYDDDLDTFWRFIQTFFFKIEGKPFTAKMRELRSRICV